MSVSYLTAGYPSGGHASSERECVCFKVTCHRNFCTVLNHILRKLLSQISSITLQTYSINLCFWNPNYGCKWLQFSYSSLDSPGQKHLMDPNAQLAAKLANSQRQAGYNAPPPQQQQQQAGYPPQLQAGQKPGAYVSFLHSRANLLIQTKVTMHLQPGQSQYQPYPGNNPVSLHSNTRFGVCRRLISLRLYLEYT